VALHLDEVARAGHHDVHVGAAGGILGVIEVEQRLALDDPDGNRGDEVLYRILRDEPLRAQPRVASARATMAPVIDAQRVPPSAWSTSQSMVIWRSPIASSRVTDLKLLPMSLWISWVRPDCLPVAASREPRVCVARGSIPYSAVTHPEPFPLRNPGTFSSTLAVHRTRVNPISTSTEPPRAS
jgi:hypothetical protein